jgi:hypothetical protein
LRHLGLSLSLASPQELSGERLDAQSLLEAVQVLLLLLAAVLAVGFMLW